MGAALRTIPCEEAPVKKNHELLITEYFWEEIKKNTGSGTWEKNCFE